jgi:hypothetical protein
MQKLNYLPLKGRGRISDTIRLFFAGFGCILAVCALWLIPMWVHILSFRARTSETKVLGKTSSQIITLVGTPDDQVTYLDGSKDLIYLGEEEACRIEIRRGLATKVLRWSK